ncbi:hypothetical protein L596_029673 [Steinernema carpocapsae]|uniref:Uncharacterized protein n=1 Tax=Steinernema carpocapsae TaxID=34508 RepID=A0A4U5LVB8_STECR|nr:hypothetical protein L596_029673 [Steinernema carpocapsae]
MPVTIVNKAQNDALGRALFVHGGLPRNLIELYSLDNNAVPEESFRCYDASESAYRCWHKSNPQTYKRMVSLIAQRVEAYWMTEPEDKYLDNDYNQITCSAPGGPSK